MLRMETMFGILKHSGVDKLKRMCFILKKVKAVKFTLQKKKIKLKEE